MQSSSNRCEQLATKGSIYDDQQQNEQRKQQEKKAQKNALQFFSRLITDHLQNTIIKEQKDSNKSLKVLLQKMRQNPTLNNFTKLFEMKNQVQVVLARFFYSRFLWRDILNSKIRCCRYKMVYRNTINVLKRGFILGKLTRLAIFSKKINDGYQW